VALFRQFDEADNTVQFLYKGEPITQKMKVDDPKALLEGLSDALNTAYNKLRDTNAISR
jgi:hypothetical protein